MRYTVADINRVADSLIPALDEKSASAINAFRDLLLNSRPTIPDDIREQRSKAGRKGALKKQRMMARKNKELTWLRKGKKQLKQVKQFLKKQEA